jgi:xylulokinase
MLADLYGCKVKTAQNTEGPALGAAILAAVGAKLYKTVPEACRAIIQIDREQEPVKENIGKYERAYAMYCKLYPAMKGLFAEIAGL